MWRFRDGITGLLLSLTLAFVTAGCATNNNFDYSKEPDPRTQEYLVGPGDKLTVLRLGDDGDKPVRSQTTAH